MDSISELSDLVVASPLPEAAMLLPTSYKHQCSAWGIPQHTKCQARPPLELNKKQPREKKKKPVHSAVGSLIVVQRAR